VVEEERANTWTELHDGMGQDVSYSRMLLEQVMTTWSTAGALAPIDGEKLRNAYQFVHALQRQVNYLLDIWRERDASELWSAGEPETAVDACGFFADLQEHATLVQRSLEIRCLVRPVGDDAALPASLRHDARMIAREAVYNAYRHGRATEVTIDAVVDEDALRLTICDNGCGFDTRRLSKKAHGMTNIQRRADRHDGAVTLDSSREAGRSGTTVSVIFQLAPETSPHLARIERRHTAQDATDGALNPQNVVEMPMFVAAPTSVGEGERYDD
jgi:nitrate/nitrite-specific signal transduction histidine kinase